MNQGQPFICYYKTGVYLSFLHSTLVSCQYLGCEKWCISSCLILHFICLFLWPFLYCVCPFGIHFVALAFFVFFFCILYESIISSSMRFCLHINIQNWSFVYIFTSKLRFCLHLKVQYWNFVCIASSTFTYHLVSLRHHLHPWDSNFVYS